MNRRIIDNRVSLLHMSHSPFFQSNPSMGDTSFEKMEWFDALDSRCKLEAILAGHVPPSPHFRPVEYPVVHPISPETMPHNLVILSTPPASPLMRSCQSGVRSIVKLTRALQNRNPPSPVTPSRYRSPSPDTICCGLLCNPKPNEVYA